VKRQYALRLRCLGCRRFLYGDVGRYRHPSPTCDAFRAAVPLVRRQRTPAHDTRIKGHSYPQAWYEGAVGALLGEIGSVDEATLAEVVRLHAACRPEVDELALARIDRERDAATRKLAQTRDVAAWQAAMGRLDAAEALARQPPAGARLTPPEVVAYLRSLPALWADSGPDARQTLATAVFARTDVLGFERMEYELTPDAIALGLDAALPAVFELRDQIGEFGRGERDRASDTELRVAAIRLAGSGLRWTSDLTSRWLRRRVVCRDAFVGSVSPVWARRASLGRSQASGLPVLGSLDWDGPESRVGARRPESCRARQNTCSISTVPRFSWR
jgi:hypothetical protein